MTDPLNALDHSITTTGVFDEWEARQTGDTDGCLEARRMSAARPMAQKTKPYTDGTRLDRIIARLKARNQEGGE